MHKDVRILLSPPHFGDLNLTRRKNCYCFECGGMALKEPHLGNKNGKFLIIRNINKHKKSN